LDDIEGHYYNRHCIGYSASFLATAGLSWRPKNSLLTGNHYTVGLRGIAFVSSEFSEIKFTAFRVETTETYFSL